MAEHDPARAPQEPGGGPAPVQGREQWIQNAGAALGESEEEYEKVVGGPT